MLQAASVILMASLGISYFFKPSFCLALIVIIPLAVSTYLVNLLRGIVNNLENRRFSVYSLLFETVLKISLFSVLVNFFHASALLLLTSTLLASISVCVAIFLYLKTLAEYKVTQKTIFQLKEIVLFTYPISIGAIINWIQLQSYTIILVSLGFVEIVGIFGTITNIGSSGMNACSTVFSQLFVPNLYKTHGRYISVYLRNALLIVLGVAIFSILASKIIIGLLTKRELLEYSRIIIYGILTEAGNFIIGALTIYLTIKNLTKTTIKMSSLGLVVFFASFGVLYVFKQINVYTLGIPMVLTQLVISLGLYTIVHKQKNINE
ncbi:hypothetical protein FPZ43_01470 [Mucilaginibacter pallidiroseus]|uniref:Polysaccharide biosynthesis protein C-terminal domain-containing protein n=1 Tax=Mucilaginibacter pallidiroseus TaxID=2599295 RepID=A0A563UIF7_9SPHI|nr:hypothetical protein [Mucilaginibacter pallidiroseus]TWR31174.1 hypothetical protein FPZ43_01470 [Mucilaginibacter pallidiroseus]